VARRGVEVEVVDLPELADLAQRLGRKRRLALERVQHDALEQVAQSHVLVLGDGLEHLEDTALQAHASLDAGYDDPGSACHGPVHAIEWYQCTNVRETTQVSVASRLNPGGRDDAQV
jgi:hypothetical protein